MLNSPTVPLHHSLRLHASSLAALRCGRKNPSFRDSASLYAKIKLNSKLHISRVGAVFVVMRSLRPYTVLAYGCAPQSAKIATVGVYISVFHLQLLIACSASSLRSAPLYVPRSSSLPILYVRVSPIRSATLSRRSVALSLRSLAPKRRDNSAPNVLIIASCHLPLAFAPCPLPGTASVPEANHAKVLTIIYVGFYYASYPRA